MLSLMALSLCGVQLQNLTSIRWVDHIDKSNMNIFFDRVVFILIEKAGNGTDLNTHSVLSIGVLINNETVLTSFNPFREHIKDKDARKKVHVSVLHERHITDWKKVEYTLKNYSIDCARQIIPVADKDDMWHDDKKGQSPLHDLMVIRLNESLALIDNDPSLYKFSHFSQWGLSTQTAGPMVTPLSPRRRKLGRTLKFASLGFLNRRHISKFCLLYSHVFRPEDNVKTDCDSWIPRQWGAFICIRNIDNYKGLGSGALLFSNKLLFGVGSFVLKKGKDSILVFTDVRSYISLIHDTCTVEDQALEAKTTTSTTTTTTTTTVPP